MVRKRDAFLCQIGFICYWSWVFCVTLSNRFTPVLVLGPIPLDSWFVSTISHALTLIAFGLMASRCSSNDIETNLHVVAPSASLGGFAIMLIPGSFGISPVVASLVGSAIVGFGTACWVLIWAASFSLCGTDMSKTALMFCAIVVSMIADFALMETPSSILVFVLVFLPIIGTLCIVQSGKGSKSLFAVVPKDREERLSSRFVAYCVVFPVPLGFFQTWLHSEGNGMAAWVPIFMGSIAVMLLAACGEFALFKSKGRHVHLAEKVVMPVMVAGLFLLSAFDQRSFAFSGALIFAAQQVMDVVIYSRLAVIASRRDISTLRVWALGISSTDLGYIIGIVAGNLVRDVFASHVTIIILGIAYVVVMVAFLTAGIWKSESSQSSALSKFSDANKRESGSSFLSGESTGAAPEGLLAHPIEIGRDRLDSLAEEKGLTPRERELLDYLLRGKNVPAIASEVFLSPTTVRSHIAHIYQKFDVHSRNDLIDLIETDLDGLYK